MPESPDCIRPPVRILVLDDEVSIVELLCEMLKIMGYEAVAASRPGEALELLGREKFDLVLSDYRMPEMNGRAFHAQVLVRDAALARRIIFLTGDTVSDETRLFLSASGNPHIGKPFQLAGIQRVIEETLARWKETASSDQK